MGMPQAPSGTGTASGRASRQAERQREITDLVISEGTVRIEQMAERFGISVMTVHRDLDELEARGLLRKSRGVATALSTSLIESSDVYRVGRQSQEKEELAQAALDYIEPGQAIFLDDSTTVLRLVQRLHRKTPLTVITNVLTHLNELNGVRDISLISLGGDYHNWCSAFMGRMTLDAVAKLRADTFIMSTAAITDDICFHQSPETVDVKRAMFESSKQRILLVDHTKFERRALHALVRLDEYDLVVVDSRTDEGHISRMQAQGINVLVAPRLGHPEKRRGGVGPAARTEE